MAVHDNCTTILATYVTLFIAYFPSTNIHLCELKKKFIFVWHVVVLLFWAHCIKCTDQHAQTNMHRPTCTDQHEQTNMHRPTWTVQHEQTNMHSCALHVILCHAMSYVSKNIYRSGPIWKHIFTCTEIKDKPTYYLLPADVWLCITCTTQYALLCMSQ